MRSLLVTLPLLALGACSPPKAMVVVEPGQPTAPAAAPQLAELSTSRPDDQLMTPGGLLSMPRESDMRSTTERAGSPGSTVVASPPDEADPSSDE